MATPGRSENINVSVSGLDLALRQTPFEFEFFQAVRLLQRRNPERKVVGRFFPPSTEAIRFVANTAPPFPASEVQALAIRESGPPLMTVNFMGMFGPQGVLPLYYTELIGQRQRAGDTALRDFLNMFNHRMISLFYQAWEKYRFHIPYERHERDKFSHHLLDAIGLGTPGLQNRQAVKDYSLAFYSGLLSLRSKPEEALRNVLMDYFEVPVTIEQFVGGWYPIDSSNQCRFGDRSTYSEQVGVGAVVGDEIWDPQSAVRVRLGPLTLRQYLDFLPNGSAYQPLKAITRFFAGTELDFELQLVLQRDEVPPCELGSTGEVAPQLGWCTWMKTAPFRRDPDETILTLKAG